MIHPLLRPDGLPPAKRNFTSIYKGVSSHCGKWRVQISKNTLQYYIGLFDTEILAAYAYNNAAIKLFGNSARLNVIKE